MSGAGLTPSNRRKSASQRRFKALTGTFPPVIDPTLTAQRPPTVRAFISIRALPRAGAFYGAPYRALDHFAAGVLPRAESFCGVPYRARTHFEYIVRVNVFSVARVHLDAVVTVEVNANVTTGYC